MRVFIGMESSGVSRRAFAALGHDVLSCDFLAADDGETTAHIQGEVFATLDGLAAEGWRPDLGIFHPECTFHTVSAAWAFKEPNFDRYPGVGYHQRVRPGTLTGRSRHEARERAEADVERIRLLPIKRKVMENPRGTIPTRTKLGAPLQEIQPFQFGHDASKATWLWFFDENGAPLPEMRLPVDPALYVKPRLVCDACKGDNDYDSAFGHGCAHCGGEPGGLRPRWANQTGTGQNRLSPGESRWKDRSKTYDGIADAFARAWGVDNMQTQAA